MARRSDVRSRSEIQETKDQHKRDMDEKAQELGESVEDNETVRETDDALDMGGTAEGADQIEGAMDRAQEVTYDVFERQDRELEGVQEESERDGTDLKERGKSAETDMSRIDSAAAEAHNRETADGLAKAKEMVAEDREFLDDTAEEEEQAHEESERLQKEYGDRVSATQGA